MHGSEKVGQSDVVVSNEVNKVIYNQKETEIDNKVVETGGGRLEPIETSQRGIEIGGSILIVETGRSVEKGQQNQSGTVRIEGVSSTEEPVHRQEDRRSLVEPRQC